MSSILISRGFRCLYGDGLLSEWELRPGDGIAWRLLWHVDHAELHVCLVDSNALLPCGSIDFLLPDLETKLFPLVDAVDSLPVLREIWWRSGMPCTDARGHMLKINAQEPPWRTMASPTQLWLDCLPPLHTVEAGFLQSVEPMLLRAGYSANGRYWILETDRKAIVVTLHCYALIATNWEQGDDLAWRDVDTNVITDIEAEDAAGTVQEWLKQR